MINLYVSECICEDCVKQERFLKLVKGLMNSIDADNADYIYAKISVECCLKDEDEDHVMYLTVR